MKATPIDATPIDATPIDGTRERAPRRHARPLPMPRFTVGTRRLRAALAALTPAVTVTVAALVAVSSGGTAHLAAALWTTGLVALATAVDIDGTRAAAHAALGVSVMALAWMGHAVAAEFALLSALAVAGWLGHVTWRALRRR